MNEYVWVFSKIDDYYNYIFFRSNLVVWSDIIFIGFINNTNHVIWFIGVYGPSYEDRVSNVIILITLKDGIWHIMS